MKHNKEAGLKRKIEECGISIKELSEISGIGMSTLYRKLRGDGSFTVDNILRLARVLDLDKNEIMNIFFNKKVS